MRKLNPKQYSAKEREYLKCLNISFKQKILTRKLQVEHFVFAKSELFIVKSIYSLWLKKQSTNI